MPNRMLRDWTQSDRVDEISCEAERFFVRLIMKVDDYGCFYADTRLLKANLFPLKLDSVREADILRWMDECQKAGLIVLYESEQKKYLQIIDFKQRLDKAKAKFPLPVNDSVKVVNDFPPEGEAEVEQNSNTKEKGNAPEFPEKLKSDRLFFERIAQAWGIDEHSYETLIDEFNAMLFSKKKIHNEFGEFKSHFFNWANKIEKKKRVSTKENKLLNLH